MQKNEFIKIVDDYYFPVLLRKAMEAFTNDIPEDLMEEAYKRKFRLKNPLDEQNKKMRLMATEKKEVAEEELFNREMNFLQSKNQQGNVITIFMILDSDRDGVLTFSEF